MFCISTRVVQKMIETSRHSKQLICSIMSVLEPSFLELFKDDNGMHVVNRCLNCLSNEDNMVYRLFSFLLNLIFHNVS